MTPIPDTPETQETRQVYSEVGYCPCGHELRLPNPPVCPVCKRNIEVLTPMSSSPREPQKDETPQVLATIQALAKSEWANIAVVPEHIRAAMRGADVGPMSGESWPSITWSELFSFVSEQARLHDSVAAFIAAKDRAAVRYENGSSTSVRMGVIRRRETEAVAAEQRMREVMRQMPKGEPREPHATLIAERKRDIDVCLASLLTAELLIKNGDTKVGLAELSKGIAQTARLLALKGA